MNSKLTFLSFGYNNGKPAEGFVYNLKNMKSPNGDLRKKYTGKDSELQRAVFDLNKELYEKIVEDLKQKIESNNEDLTFCFGCHEGVHRSVSFVEKLSLENWEGYEVIVIHRDLKNKSTKIDKKNIIRKNRDIKKQFLN